MKDRRFYLCISLLLITLLLSGCNDVVKVTGVKFIYGKSFYFESARGKEINFYGDCDDRFGTWMDNKPEEIDLYITVKNPSFFNVKQTVLNVEIWFDKAKDRFSHEADVDNYVEALEIMYKDAKPELVWEKSINLKNIGPYKDKVIKIEKINIRDLMEKEFEKDNNYVMGFRCIARSGNYLEKYIIHKIGY